MILEITVNHKALVELEIVYRRVATLEFAKSKTPNPSLLPGSVALANKWEEN